MFSYFPDDFDWSSMDESAIKFIRGEYYRNVYEIWRSIRQGDIVVDIGSSVGPMAYSALSSGAKQVYAVEPSIEYSKAILNNTNRFKKTPEDTPCVLVNKAISETPNNDSINVFGNNKIFTSISFGELIENYSLSKINFLKIDCEGGEYDILMEKYYYYLRYNVDYIACEMHYRFIPNGKEKFRKFRDTFLSKFPRNSYKFFDIIDNKYTDITDWILTDDGSEFLLNQSEAMLYIKNN